jgi:hypothetical protein
VEKEVPERSLQFLLSPSFLQLQRAHREMLKRRSGVFRLNLTYLAANGRTNGHFKLIVLPSYSRKDGNIESVCEERFVFLQSE